MHTNELEKQLISYTRNNIGIHENKYQQCTKLYAYKIYFKPRSSPNFANWRLNELQAVHFQTKTQDAKVVYSAQALDPKRPRLFRRVAIVTKPKQRRLSTPHLSSANGEQHDDGSDRNRDVRNNKTLTLVTGRDIPARPGEVGWSTDGGARSER